MSRRQLKSQGKLLELIIGTLFVIFLLIMIYFYFYQHHLEKIEEIAKQNAYEVAVKSYKVLQSDQALSISSKEKGFLDLSKLESVNESGMEEEMCDHMEKLITSKVYVYIKDLESYPNKVFEICPKRKGNPMYFFDLYVNIYDPYNNTIHLGYIKIGVVS